MKLKTLFIAAFTVASLHGQEKPADPYRAAKASPEAAIPTMELGPPNISICYETFSMPLAMAAKLQRTQLPDPELYKQILAALEKEEVRQETFMMLRVRNGQKATSEGISELIYPTQYELPKTPNSVTIGSVPPSVPDTGKPDASPDLKSLDGIINTPATPSAFEAKNTGVTLQLEPTLSEDETIMDLRMLPEHIALVGHTNYGQGLSKVEMPIFEKQSVSTSAVIRVNQPFLLGTVSRPPNSKVDGDSANRVWFAFVTGTLARP